MTTHTFDYSRELSTLNQDIAENVCTSNIVKKCMREAQIESSGRVLSKESEKC